MTTPVTVNCSGWTRQLSSPILDGAYPITFRPSPSAYVFSDANYPDIPTYSEVGSEQRFFDSAATGTADGLTWANAFTDEETALFDITSGTGGTKLTCRGTFTIPVGGIYLNGRAGVGSSGNEILFRADPVSGCTIDNSNNDHIRFSGQSRWIVYGFTTTGGATLFAHTGASAQITSYITFRNIEGTMGVGGDNVGLITCSNSSTVYADYWGVFNCKITGPGSVAEGIHGNTSCIYLRWMKNFRVMNNNLTNAPKLIYYKHHNESTYVIGGGFINSNYIYGSTGDVHMAIKGQTLNNNISTLPFTFSDDGGGDDGADNNTIDHNTLFDTALSFHPNDNVSQGNTGTNNIVGELHHSRYETGVDSTNITNYNLIVDDIVWHRYVSYTLANWKLHALAQDANSITGTPTYVGGATPTTVAGFALDTGSVGKNAANDGEDMGADVSSVGSGW